MDIQQTIWTPDAGLGLGASGALEGTDLVLAFGGRSVLQDAQCIGALHEAYPEARILGCSTAGEISDTQVSDDTLVATAVRFEDTGIQLESALLEEVAGESDAIGKHLAGKLRPEGLSHVFVLSDGLGVNGSQLVAGLTEGLAEGVTISGGLSADGDRFEETLVLAGDDARTGRVAVLGLYGDRIKVGAASLGGWDPFGLERRVTRSEGNVLYELDGTSALELYKMYLGEHASGLPATGLLYPMTIRMDQGQIPVVRTILGVDEAEGSLTFAGDVPEGALGRLMKANFDRLVDGAADAAKASSSGLGEGSTELAILISCVGRKMVLNQRVEEELEAVREALGSQPVLAGFYSYGEISPFTPNAKCELHNQTMTVTTLSEQ